jgi:hypothetical protein
MPLREAGSLGVLLLGKPRLFADFDVVDFVLVKLLHDDKDALITLVIEPCEQRMLDPVVDCNALSF